jgi:hypothetical protein
VIRIKLSEEERDQLRQASTARQKSLAGYNQQHEKKKRILTTEYTEYTEKTFSFSMCSVYSVVIFQSVNLFFIGRRGFVTV